MRRAEAMRLRQCLIVSCPGKSQVSSLRSPRLSPSRHRRVQRAAVKWQAYPQLCGIAKNYADINYTWFIIFLFILVYKLPFGDDV